MTEETVNSFYKKSSARSSDMAERLAWMFIIMSAAGLTSGHAYQTFFVCAVWSVLYMLLGVLQYLWQAVASWVFMVRMQHLEKRYEDNLGVTVIYPKSFPDYIGFGAWVLFYMKMACITIAVSYFVYRVMS